MPDVGFLLPSLGDTHSLGMDDFDSVLHGLDFTSDAEELLDDLDDSGYPSGERSRMFWALGFETLEESLRATGWDGGSVLLPMLSPVESQLGAPQDEDGMTFHTTVDSIIPLEDPVFAHPFNLELPHSLVFYATGHSLEGGQTAAVLVGATRAGQQWAWVSVPDKPALLLDLSSPDLPSEFYGLPQIRHAADWMLLAMGADLPRPALGITQVAINYALLGSLELTEGSRVLSPDFEERQAGSALVAATEFRRQMLALIHSLLKASLNQDALIEFEGLLDTLEITDIGHTVNTPEKRRQMSAPRVLEVIDEGLDILRSSGWEGADPGRLGELLGAPPELSAWLGARGLGRLIQVDLPDVSTTLTSVSEWAGPGVDLLISDLQDLGVEVQ